MELSGAVQDLSYRGIKIMDSYHEPSFWTDAICLMIIVTFLRAVCYAIARVKASWKYRKEQQHQNDVVKIDDTTHEFSTDDDDANDNTDGDKPKTCVDKGNVFKRRMGLSPFGKQKRVRSSSVTSTRKDDDAKDGDDDEGEIVFVSERDEEEGSIQLVNHKRAVPDNISAQNNSNSSIGVSPLPLSPDFSPSSGSPSRQSSSSSTTTSQKPTVGRGRSLRKEINISSLLSVTSTSMLCIPENDDDVNDDNEGEASAAVTTVMENVVDSLRATTTTEEDHDDDVDEEEGDIIDV